MASAILEPGTRDRMLALIDTILAWPERTLCFSADAPTADAIHSRLRIAVIVRGVAEYAISSAHAVHTCRAGRGDMLACLPWGHFAHWPVRAGGYRMFTCILWDSYVRFLDSDRGVTHWYHTANPIRPEGWNCAAALSHLARRDDAQPQGRLITEALLHIARQDLAEDGGATGRISKSLQTYRRICEHIAAHAHQPLNRDGIARSMDLTPQHVSKLFARHHECGINDYLRSLRVRHAENLLGNPALSLAEIARLSGFESAGYLIREFRRTFGITPGAYRRQHATGQ